MEVIGRVESGTETESNAGRLYGYRRLKMSGTNFPAITERRPRTNQDDYREVIGRKRLEPDFQTESRSGSFAERPLFLHKKAPQMRGFFTNKKIV